MAEPFRVLVTGSRNFGDYGTVCEEIGLVVVEQIAATGQPHPPITVVHGAARGADFLAGRAAGELGLHQERWPADWDRHGKRAGFMRNEHMVALGASLCLAFVMPCTLPTCRKVQPHGSHGATHCAALAEAAGIPVRRING